MTAAQGENEGAFNGFRDPAATNLHTHGLHASPGGDCPVVTCGSGVGGTHVIIITIIFTTVVPVQHMNSCGHALNQRAATHALKLREEGQGVADVLGEASRRNYIKQK